MASIVWPNSKIKDATSKDPSLRAKIGPFITKLNQGDSSSGASPGTYPRRRGPASAHRARDRLLPGRALQTRLRRRAGLRRPRDLAARHFIVFATWHHMNHRFAVEKFVCLLFMLVKVRVTTNKRGVTKLGFVHGGAGEEYKAMAIIAAAITSPFLQVCGEGTVRELVV